MRACEAGFCAVSPIVLQAFTLTFVAEWGDRSQISTIAMGADQDVVGVTLGGEHLGVSLSDAIAASSPHRIFTLDLINSDRQSSDGCAPF